MEGLHPFYLEQVRKLYDLKIFLMPELELGHHWKILRDQKDRKHAKAKILEQIKKREKDRRDYIETQAKHADVLIESLPITPIKDVGNPGEEVDVKTKITCSNSVLLDPLLARLNQIEGCKVTCNYTEGDKQEVVIEGGAGLEDIERIAANRLPQLSEIGSLNPMWKDGHYGVVLLCLVYYIFESVDNE